MCAPSQRTDVDAVHARYNNTYSLHPLYPNTSGRLEPSASGLPHSLTPSFPPSLTHSLPITHPLTHSLTHTRTHEHALTCMLTRSLTHTREATYNHRYLLLLYSFPEAGPAYPVPGVEGGTGPSHHTRAGRENCTHRSHVGVDALLTGRPVHRAGLTVDPHMVRHGLIHALPIQWLRATSPL